MHMHLQIFATNTGKIKWERERERRGEKQISVGRCQMACYTSAVWWLLLLLEQLDRPKTSVCLYIVNFYWRRRSVNASHVCLCVYEHIDKKSFVCVKRVVVSRLLICHTATLCFYFFVFPWYILTVIVFLIHFISFRAFIHSSIQP